MNVNVASGSSSAKNSPNLPSSSTTAQSQHQPTERHAHVDDKERLLPTHNLDSAVHFADENVEDDDESANTMMTRYVHGYVV